MTFSTLDLANYDNCPRLSVWAREWETPRLTLLRGMYESLHVGLTRNSSAAAKDHLITLARDPGFAISSPDIFDIVMHHATLIETITEYLLMTGDGAWERAGAVKVGGIEYQPLSYLASDEWLRRVILCSSWDVLRRAEEMNSWLTLGDVIATNRPMLLTAIVIGASREGFRPSPWTRGFIHPVSKQVRILSRSGEEFGEKWKKINRERSGKSASDWLRAMQEDKAFDKHSFAQLVGVPSDARFVEAKEQMVRMLERMGDTKECESNPRRASCYKLTPCVFERICGSSEIITPRQMEWKQKTLAD